MFCSQVGPGAVSVDEAPFWAVRVLVLGQLVGYISIPNPRLPSSGEEETGAEEVMVADKTRVPCRR